MTLEAAGDARLVVECHCGRTAILSCRHLARELGGSRMIADIAVRLRCRAPECRRGPAHVILIPPANEAPAPKLRDPMEARTALPGISFQTSPGGPRIDAWADNNVHYSQDLPLLRMRAPMWSIEVPRDEAERLAYWMASWWLR